MMTVNECAKFLRCHIDTVKKNMNSGDMDKRIYAVYQGGWKIPKMQFLHELVDDWEKELE